MDARAEAEEFEHQRGYLFSIAYRLLGSVGDAEDMVQNTYLHWARESRTDIESPRAYLATIIVRLCLDELRSARAKREVYVGPWLPEPLITSGRDDLTETVAMRESLSFAFLLVLEALSPLERAVFVLREVFDYDYVDIARTVDKSIVYCRQVFHRARQHLADRQSGFETSREQQQAITEQFLHAMANGNVQEAVALLAEDVVAIGDGGGRANAALQPVYGVSDVARALQANLPNWPLAQARLLEVNGEPAIVATRGGKPFGMMLLEATGGRVQRLYVVVNPDKLKGLERT